MSLAVNINELINGKTIEWERLEFKQGWNPEDVLHTLCSFANDINNWGGGYIIIGIAEKNGRPQLPPSGLNPDIIDRIQGELTQLCHRLQPNYIPVIQPYIFMDKHILVIYAPAGDMRPYTAPSGIGRQGLKNRFSYVRIGSRTIKAQGENLRRLQELTARIPFDDRIHQSAQLHDLNLGLIRSFLQEIKSDLAEESATMPFPELCRQMQLARGPKEGIRPVNVGLLFFSNEPHRFFDRAWIEVVLRMDEAGKDFSEKYFKGPLHLQLRDALRYIKNQVIEEGVRKVKGKAESLRFFNFPYEAVEESLANAVYHKSYEIGKPIEVQVWPDKIEILSFPGPVPPITAKILAENKRIAARDYRNRRVGDFLKELHLTEGRGTGIPTIKRSLERNQSPKPIFETDEQCFYFLTILPVNQEFLNVKESNQESNQESYSDDKLQVVRDGAQEKSVQVDDQERQILLFCKKAKSKAEILELIGISNQFKNYQKHITPLLEKGWLALTHPENPRHRNQKYITTQMGRIVINDVVLY
ncbi:MAG: putative DNA binding domain-containing protein [Cryomorphaceae bacterium]|nr:putative DNA binding domain-containing protein [Cryomorphaceae bacterium]